MRRWRLFIGLGLVLLLGSLVAWFIVVPSEVRAYYWIREGMTLSEVEDVIGLPPGDYKNPKLPKYELSVSNDGSGRPVTVQLWRWDSHEIWVAFDADGKTVWKELDPNRISLFDRVRAFWGL